MSPISIFCGVTRISFYKDNNCLQYPNLTVMFHFHFGLKKQRLLPILGIWVERKDLREMSLSSINSRRVKKVSNHIEILFLIVSAKIIA